ncbi:neuroblastoma-amplified sequence [Pelobates cultripes]|uniref:Neuroblastoma-amplified sequence n=1 Tax=Pelobates cultripes TaxID=61616 RepID=A0AAD1TMR4_PELCU|nr:neuroblastoma-amplified sequence [Pelobates cultripes]
MVSSDDLLEWLRPFCGDDSLPVKPRIDVLQIMEQAFNLNDEDSKLLVFFRTQAVLKASWPEKKSLTPVQIEVTTAACYLTIVCPLSDASHVTLCAILESFLTWTAQFQPIFMRKMIQDSHRSCDSSIVHVGVILVTLMYRIDAFLI